jgi:sulfane dehydrogenase subunit SoxC
MRALRQAVGVRSHVVRRNVPWLTADPVSSINFTPLHELDGIITPNGLCFERHHGGTASHQSGRSPADDQRPGRHAAGLHHGGPEALPARKPDYFLECAANGGMEWRGAQLNGCQFTHGMIHNVVYTGVPLRICWKKPA